MARQPAFYKPGSYQPDESIGYLMKRITTGLVAQVDAHLLPQGLTHAQWVPLYKLYMGEAATAAELATSCLTDAGAMTRTLDRLEMKGLVRRARSAEDRRVVNLELTPEGSAAAQHIPEVLCDVLNGHLKGFTVEEWHTLRSLLRRMLDNGLELQAHAQAQARQDDITHEN